MAGITQAQAEAKLALWMEADEKVAAGQEYEIAGRKLKRSDAAEIRSNIQYWNNIVQRLASGRTGMRVRQFTPS